MRHQFYKKVHLSDKCLELAAIIGEIAVSLAVLMTVHQVYNPLFVPLFFILAKFLTNAMVYTIYLNWHLNSQVCQNASLWSTFNLIAGHWSLVFRHLRFVDIRSKQPTHDKRPTTNDFNFICK